MARLRARFGRSFVLGALLVTGIGVAGTAPRSHFDLPSEALDKALRDFAQQAHCNISYDPNLLRGLTAPAVQGDYLPSEALTALLKGTHLRAVSVNENTIQVLEHAAANHEAPVVATMQFAAPSLSDNIPSTSEPPAPVPPNSVDANTGLSEIVVTGTHISGVDNKTVPMLRFDRDDIERSGYGTTEDFLDSLPQNVKSSGNSADGILAAGQGINNLENSTAVNLRGLGASSTLTLLNGHRIAPSAYGTGVDISAIPLNAIERIEILTDGSSAVYGSDAVGGVVNVILRRDFNGAETNARLETLSRGGGEQKQLGQSLGTTWNGGGALGVLQFQDTNAIHSNQRDFTANLPVPTDIYPESKRYSGVVSAHQSLADSLEIYSDVLAEHENGYRAYTLLDPFQQVELTYHSNNSSSVNLGVRWHPLGSWQLENAALFSEVNTLARIDYSPSFAGYVNGTPYLRNLSSVKEDDLKLDGTLLRVGELSVKAALGGSFRREEFSTLFPYSGVEQATSRRVTAEYAELYAPVITPTDQVPLVQKLEISGAVRRDAYSDFGTRVNPRVGLYWSPLNSLGVRASFSTSFRAPNPSELLEDESANIAFVESGFPLPGGITGNALFYGNQVLGPETSRNLALGVSYEPDVLHGTRLTLNYYRINYANRIVNSPYAANIFISPNIYGPLIKQFPSDAAVDAFLAGLQPPQSLYDGTTNGTGLTGVRYAFPYGEINAAHEFTEGLDLGARSILKFRSNDQFTFDWNATYIHTLNTTFCQYCVSTDLVNTYGNPLKLRLRATAGWSNGSFSINSAVNYANAYVDTNVDPFGRIGAFTTWDANATYRLPWKRATSVSFAVANLLNANPPRTAPALGNVEYDPSNADPRGRSLALQLRAGW